MRTYCEKFGEGCLDLRGQGSILLSAVRLAFFEPCTGEMELEMVDFFVVGEAIA